MDIEIKKFRHNYGDFGTLVFIESEIDVPFSVKRVYFICDVPGDVRRGFHAHKKLEQYLICIKGSCKVMMEDISGKTDVLLDKPNEALYVGPEVWHEMYDFSEGSVLLVLASDYYDENDYLRDYDVFLKYTRGDKK